MTVRALRTTAAASTRVDLGLVMGAFMRPRRAAGQVFDTMCRFCDSGFPLTWHIRILS
jgi:hypothetical protein